MVKDRNNNNVDPKEIVFPILKNEDNGNVKMIGTGFFITKFGIFLTAKHVLEDVLDKKGRPKAGITIIQFKENFTFYYRPVKAFVLHPDADVAVGICHNMSHRVTGEPLYNKIAPLSLYLPLTNEHVYTFAYPGTKVKKTAITNVTFNAKFYAGRIEEYHPDGRDKILLPFPCYRTSIVLHGGSSGGPVFCQNGKVFGINSTGFDGSDNISYVSRIHDTLGLKIRNVVMPNETEPRNIALTDLIEINQISIN